MKRRMWMSLAAAVMLSGLCVSAALPKEIKEAQKTLFLKEAKAKNANALKNDMKKRLPEVVKLKKSGQIGETFDGYLAIVNDASVKELETVQKLVAVENSDRLMVYTAIAKKEKSDVATVGVRRAAKIREEAAVGEMFRDKAGKWSAKEKE